jgi:hypothetical protein
MATSTMLAAWIEVIALWALAWWFYWGAGSTEGDKFISVLFTALGADVLAMAFVAEEWTRPAQQKIEELSQEIRDLRAAVDKLRSR